MNKDKEIEVLKTAYFLEEQLILLKNEEDNLLIDKPSSPKRPPEPIKVDITPTRIPYPEIKPDKVNIFLPSKRIIYIALACTILTIIGGFFSVLGAFGWFMIFPLYLFDVYKAYQNKKKCEQEYIDNVKKSAEYRKKCEEIDRQNYEAQINADKEAQSTYNEIRKQWESSYEQYQKDLEDYNNIYLPNWNDRFTSLKTATDETKKSLQEVYNTNILPIQYRNRNAVAYLAVFLNTSEYDLKYAIERYDTYVMQTAQRMQISIANAQLQVAHEQLRNQQYSNWLNEQSLEIAENSNATLRSINNWQKADIALREYRRHKSRR